MYVSEKPKGVPDIRTLFGGKGKMLGSSSGQETTTKDNVSRPSGSNVTKLDGNVDVGNKITKPTSTQGNTAFLNPSKSTVSSGTHRPGGSSSAKTSTVSTIRGKENIAAASGNELERRKERINTGVKIRTINSGEAEDSGPVEKDKMANAFVGKCFTLGGQPSHQGPIKRKIPGIGYITCERPVGVNHTDSQGQTHQGVSNVLDDLKERNEETASDSHDLPKKRKLDFSSESETDDILKILIEKRKNKRRRHRSKGSKRNNVSGVSLNNSFKLRESLEETNPGTIRKISDFKSVANNKATPAEFVGKDPESLRHDTGWLTKRRRGPGAANVTPVRGGNRPWTPKTQSAGDGRTGFDSSGIDDWWTSKVDSPTPGQAGPSGIGHFGGFNKTSTPAAGSGSADGIHAKNITSGVTKISKPIPMSSLLSDEHDSKVNKPGGKPTQNIRESCALDRNARAMYGNDSESDSDEDHELRPLSQILTGSRLKNSEILSKTSAGPSSFKTTTAVGQINKKHKDISSSQAKNDSAFRDFQSLSITSQASSNQARERNAATASASVSPVLAPEDPVLTCPVCQVKVRESAINNHLDLCLG